jgi:hypothetical protein
MRSMLLSRAVAVIAAIGPSCAETTPQPFEDACAEIRSAMYDVGAEWAEDFGSKESAYRLYRSWRFESALSWQELSDRIVSRLEPRMRVATRSDDTLSMRETRPGDVFVVAVSRIESEGRGTTIRVEFSASAW